MYSTIQTLKNKIDLRQLLQYVNDEKRLDVEIDFENAPDTDICVQRVNQAAVEVQEEIDTYLRGRYKLPLATIPYTITMISDDRVIYNLKKRRFRNDITESEQKIFDQSTKQLQLIQRGEMILDIEKVSSTEATTDGQIYTNKTASDKIFTKDLMTRF
ncbi:MAG: DUF1320 domain-containing protein [Melioribacter sp.]|nr:DUF1320 domain-containing protein [Melioribacter sp.]